MRRTRRTTGVIVYFWPGLPQLWIRGSWSGLVVAAAAAVLLSWTLLGSFLWSELIDPQVRRALWASLVVVWVAAAVWSVVWDRWPVAGRQTDGHAGTFQQAVADYLKGNWFQAQRSLAVLLRRNAGDLDARLMLATLLRHTGRLDEAEKQLDVLARCEGAEKWDLEIRRERELLSEADSEADAQVEATADHPIVDSSAELKHVA